jgi:cation transporter-like permease
MSDEIFLAMMTSFQEMKNIERQLTMISIAISLLGLVVGIVLVWRMNHRYLQEVYMLTFLSDSMIARHKQVQSYIAAISKGSSKD